MKRIVLFIATNLAVLLLLSITLQVLGVESILARNRVDLDLQALLIFSAVLGFGGAFISLAISKVAAKWMTGAKVIGETTDPTERWLLDTVRRQASQAGIGMPEVAIFPAPEMNAFATGMRRDAALVAVSQGLLTGMTSDEVEAVLAHEVSHIANGDMVTMALIQGVMNTFVVFLSRVAGFLVDRVVLRNERGLGIGYFVTSIAAQILLGILASIVVMWFSRQREYRADAGGARLAGQGKMIAALERLKHGEPARMPAALAAFGISARPGFSRLFMSHPPLDERIDALRRGEPG